MRRPKHSIIIPTAGRPVAIRAAIESVLAQRIESQGAELIIVDNNTDDEMAADLFSYCRKWEDRLRYYRESSPGLSAARHCGANESQGNYLTFLDDDVEVSQTWLSAIQRAYEDSEVAMVGGPSIPKFTCSIPSWFWDFFSPTPYGGWMNPWLSLLDIGQDVNNIDPNYIWGLNFSIRKKVLYDAGGFHPDLVPKTLQRWQGDGETGLTRKVKESGYKAAYVQDASLNHLCGADRLNIDYFKRRAYYQGVCDSFTFIRSGNAPSQKTIPGLSTSPFNKLKNIARKTLRSVQSKSSRWAEDAREVRQITEQAYYDGYRFHQSEVFNDTLLMDWVRRPDYFNTDIRSIQL
jgi:glucosyl-dolichyl phosphate glucuronosyltransferase